MVSDADKGRSEQRQHGTPLKDKATEPGNSEASEDKAHRFTDALEGLGEVDHALRSTIGTGREVAASVAGTVKDSLKTVRKTRDSVVMVRLNKDSLQRIDELVDCQVTKSRSEAAALLINEGIKARADLFNEVAEQAEIIRQARERLRTLLGTDEPPESTSS